MPQKDPQKRREYMQEWRRRNPDKVHANSIRDQERQKEYRRAHLIEYAGYQRKRRETHPRETLVDAAKSRAKRDGLPFSITVESLHWPTNCPVLGIELDYNRTSAGERSIRNNYPSLDRRVNELGYVQGNVFVISHRANRIKSDATVAELEAIILYMK